MSEQKFKALVEQIHQAGERLRLALVEEERLSAMARRFPNEESIFLHWAQAKHTVEHCEREYMDAVAPLWLSRSGSWNP